jgi:glycosyltransferase involved in cell wall biosynthesis
VRAGTLSGRRIVFVLGSLELGGSERQALLLARFLKKECGADVRVWGLKGGGGTVSAACDAQGIPWRGGFLRWPEGRVGRFKQLVGFAGTLRSERPDAVLPYTWLPNVVCGLAWKTSGAKACIWNQRDEGIGLDGGGMERLAVRMTPRFLANSEGGKAFLAGHLGVPEDRIRVVPNGVLLPPSREDRPAWRDRIGAKEGCCLALMLASVHPHKDHAALLRAWRRVLDRAGKNGRPPVLLLAGRSYGYEEELKALAFDLGLGDSVRFLGPVDDVAGLLQAVDLCVHSAKTEGLPNAVLEAMAAGVPVAATDLPGIRAAVGEACFRFLAPPGDHEALADRILELAGSERLRVEVGAMLKKRAAEEFSAAGMCRASVDVILEALGGGA